MPDGHRPARADPGRLQRPPARGRLGPLRGDHRELEAPGPGDGRDHGDQADQRPRGVHPRQRVLPRRDRGRRASSSPPASAPTASPAPAGSARSMAEWIAEGEPSASTSGTWTSAASAPSTARPPTRTRGSRRPTRPTTTSATRTTSAGRPAAAGLRRPMPGTASTMPPSARSRAGSGSTGTSRTRRPGTSRCARAAGRASTGRRRSAPSTGRPGRASRSSTSPPSPKIEIAGPGAAAAPRAALRQPGRPRGRPDHLHADAQQPRRDRVRLHRRPPRRRSASRSSPGPPSATTTASGSAGTCRRTVGDPGRRRHLAVGLLRRLGPAGARPVGAADARRTSRNEAFPYMSLREITVGDVPARALRVTYVGELGWELYCPTEYGLGLWRALWEAGRAARDDRRRLPGDRLDAAGEGLPRLGRRHHPRRDPLRGRRSASA